MLVRRAALAPGRVPDPAPHAPQALARAVGEGPRLGVARIVGIAFREKAVRDRVLLVERDDAAERGAMAMTDERSGRECEPTPGPALQAPGEVEVAAERHRRVEAAQRFNQRAGICRVGRLRERHDRMCEGALGADRVPCLPALDRARGGERLDRAGDAADVGVREGGDQVPDPRRVGHAVGVGEGENVTVRRDDATVPRRVRALNAGLRDQPDRILGYDRARVVGRAVVHHDELERVRRPLEPAERV